MTVPLASPTSTTATTVSVTQASTMKHTTTTVVSSFTAPVCTPLPGVQKIRGAYKKREHKRVCGRLNMTTTALRRRLSAHDVTYDDFARTTPAPTSTPTQGMESDPPYRCPVSTPANFVQLAPHVRRAKPANLEISLSGGAAGQRAAGGRVGRSVGGAFTRQHALTRLRAGRGPAGMSRGAGGVGADKSAVHSRKLDYYYVDKTEERREQARVNTFWLKTLCAQPVHEILDKYRRRSELWRTKVMWSKSNTTPGERSLLQAWQRNGVRRTVPDGAAMTIPQSPSQQRAPTFSRGEGQQTLDAFFSGPSDRLAVFSDGREVDECRHNPSLLLADLAVVAPRPEKAHGEIMPPVGTSSHQQIMAGSAWSQPLGVSQNFQTSLPSLEKHTLANHRRLTLNHESTLLPAESPKSPSCSPGIHVASQPGVSGDPKPSRSLPSVPGAVLRTI